MMDLTAFLAENVEIRENKKVVVSDRFKDKKGNPIEWEIRSITAEEDSEIRKKCLIKTPIVGRPNKFTQDFDAFAYGLKTTAKAVVYPNLNDATLLKSYGVQSGEKLLSIMLYKDELDTLMMAVNSLSETEDINELVEEAKN